MQQTIITADSTFDMPPQMAAEYGIKVIPSYVRMGEKNHADTSLVNPNELFRFYERTGILPQTASANPNDYIRFFGRFTEQGKTVIHIAKSSGMSSCCNNALFAAGTLEKVYVVDSESISGGSALLALYAAEHNRDSPQEQLNRLYEYKNTLRGSFIIEQLEYLHKGGRCSSVAMLGANALRLRPCIQIHDGKMSVGKKYRGTYQKCLFCFIDEQLSELQKIDPTYLFISHSIQDESLLASVNKYVESMNYFEKVVAWPVGAGVAVHCGPNTFGLFFSVKQPKK